MFNYNVFIVLVIVGNVLSNPIDNSSGHCCFARDRYSYKVDHTFHHRIFNGSPSTTHVKAYFAYDAERGLFAKKGTITVTGEQSNGETSYLEIFNLETKDYYSVDITQNTCTKIPNIALGTDCVDVWSVHANSSMQIHDGKQTVVDTWISQGEDYVSYQKVRRDDCFMLESSHTSLSQGMNSTTIKYDLLQDIADPTIFQLPSSCL